MTTPLYPTFRKRITDAFALLETRQVEPWALFNSGHPMEVLQHNGKKIHYGGIRFEGSPHDVFWGRYIDPFLESLSVSEIDAAVSLSKERNVDTVTLLEEIRGLLIAGCRKIFSRMAEIDRRLLGRGYPDRVSLRPVDMEIARMASFINERIDAEIKMVPPRTQSPATVSEISDEGRQARFAQWDAIGVDRIRADLERGGTEVVGGPPAVRNLAWEWLHLREEGLEVVGPAKNDDEVKIITEVVKKEMSVAINTFKEEIQKLKLSNVTHVEIYNDFRQIEAELERPEPRPHFLKMLFEGVRDRLIKYIGEKGVEIIVQQLTTVMISWFLIKGGL